MADTLTTYSMENCNHCACQLIPLEMLLMSLRTEERGSGGKEKTDEKEIGHLWEEKRD